MMKKMISILTALLLCTQPVLSVFAVETEPALLPIEAEFTDVNFLNAVREIIGKTNNEHIYKSDVENITELNIVDKDIKSLNGLKYFTGLKTLLCYVNEFEELDVSHNTELEVLDCSYNMQLIALDVSHNPKLEALDCNYNILTSLDVSKNTKLKRLVCFYSRISELNLENNPLLERLDVRTMKLTSLDLSKNKNLKHLNCGHNRLTKLDLSNQLNLERLICNSNYMDNDSSKSIIGYDAVVTQLGEPSAFGNRTSDFTYYPQREPAIENEFIDANFLAAVRKAIGKTNGEHIYQSDVANITELDISEKEIKDLHGIEYFTGLESFICYFNDFSEMNLSHNVNLKYLDFSYNTDIKTVDLSNNSALETVECNNTNVESLNIANNTNLKKLVCYNSLISELNLKNSTQLEVLDAWGLNLTNLDVSMNTNLKYLDCSWNKLTALDVSNNSQLELLMCNQNYMDKNPRNGIIGYDMIVERLGEPTTYVNQNQKTGFIYYPQKEAHPYQITTLCLKDTSGAVIKKPQKNTSFIIEANVVKTEARDKTDYLFVAVYDTDGALISLDYVKAKFAVDGECSFGFYIPAQAKNIGSVKAFVWNAFDSMVPLAETKILTFTDTQ